MNLNDNSPKFVPEFKSLALKFFPESALVQLEYEKVKVLLAAHCRTEYARAKAAQLRIHTKKEFIDNDLRQSHEYKHILSAGLYFPNDFTLNLQKEIKLLGIPGAVLSGEQFLQIKKLAENTAGIFRWFDAERRIAFSALSNVINDSYFEKTIVQLIDEVLDETGTVKDNASEE